MQQPKTILETGTRVRTSSQLDTANFRVDHIDQRRANAPGEIHGVVGGFGGDVYWIRHGAAPFIIAPYGFWEFELAKTKREEELEKALRLAMKALGTIRKYSRCPDPGYGGCMPSYGCAFETARDAFTCIEKVLPEMAKIETPNCTCSKILPGGGWDYCQVHG